MKVEFDVALWGRVKQHAAGAGYCSPEEFVQHVVEREIDSAESPEEGQRAARKLHGLGYLDAGLDI